MDQAVLIAGVRAELGKITNTVDIEDVDILREAGWILNRIGQKITKKMLRAITTVAAQRDYAVHASTIRVMLLLPPDEITDFRLRLGDYIVGERCIDDEYYNFPSMWTINMSRRARGLAKLQFTFNPVERILKIDPTPIEAGKLIYYISVEACGWTIAQVPPEFEEIVVTGVTWKSLEIVFLRRSTEGGIERMGGRVDYPANQFKPFIDEKKNEFKDELRMKSMLYNSM